MYAKYNYGALSTIANIHADICAILTGTTDKATLSANCDQVNTTISAAYNVAGWVTHDLTANSLGTCTISNTTPAVVTKTAHGLVNGQPISFTTTGALPSPLASNTTYYVLNSAANTFNVEAFIGGGAIATTSAGSGAHTLWSATKRVLKSAVADDLTYYKYMMVDATTAGYIQLHLYETWNATAHTGTNQATAIATTAQQRVDTTSPGVMVISAKKSHCVMQSIIAAGTGAVTNGDWTGVFERSRLSPWDTVGAAYPPSAIMVGSSIVSGAATSACKFKNPSGGDYTGASAAQLETAWLGGYGGTGNNGWMGLPAMDIKVPDGLGGFYTPFTEFHVRKRSSAFMGGSISAICDVWLGISYPLNLDEVVYNSKTYVFWRHTSTAGSGCLLVPKG